MWLLILSHRVLSNEEDKAGSYSLKHGAVTNAASAFAEDIFDRTNWKGLLVDILNSVQRLKTL